MTEERKDSGTTTAAAVAVAVDLMELQSIRVDDNDDRNNKQVILHPKAATTLIGRYGWFSTNPLLEAGIHKIADNLFLGNCDGARNKIELDRLQVKAIVNCTPRGYGGVSNHFPSEFAYERVAWQDDPSETIETGLLRAYKFMVDQIETKKQAVLVHCVAGVSRSSTVVIYYLMRSRGLSLLTAYQLAKRGRWCVDPNAGFLRQLIQIESKLYDGKTSIDSRATEWPALEASAEGKPLIVTTGDNCVMSNV